jgi:hypothetical protein
MWFYDKPPFSSLAEPRQINLSIFISEEEQASPIQT